MTHGPLAEAEEEGDRGKNRNLFCVLVATFYRRATVLTKNRS